MFVDLLSSLGWIGRKCRSSYFLLNDFSLPEPSRTWACLPAVCPSVYCKVTGYTPSGMLEEALLFLSKSLQDFHKDNWRVWSATTIKTATYYSSKKYGQTTMTVVRNCSHLISIVLFVFLRDKLLEYLRIKTQVINFVNLRKKEFKTWVISKLLPSVYKDLIQIFMNWLVK